MDPSDDPGDIATAYERDQAVLFTPPNVDGFPAFTADACAAIGGELTTFDGSPACALPSGLYGPVVAGGAQPLPGVTVTASAGSPWGLAFLAAGAVLLTRRRRRR